LQSLFSLAVQNSVEMRQIGVVTSASQFFRQIGSTVGVAIFGTLMTNTLNGKLNVLTASQGLPPMSLGQLRGMSANAQAHGAGIHMPPAFSTAIADSVTHVIFLSLAAVLIAIIATLMIPALPMRERKPATGSKDSDELIPPDAHL
jgi:hypothetical protein